MNRTALNILIVKLSAIGDVVHTLPALNALRRHYPEARITWLVEEAAAELLTGHPALDRLLVSRRKTWLAGLGTRQRATHLRQVMAFLKDLRDTRYDIILDFQAALKGALLIALARGKRKIGFGPGMQHQEHSYLVLNERIPMVSMEIHALERGLKMVEALGVPGSPVEYNLPIGSAPIQKVKQLLSSAQAKPGRKAVAINLMAKWETKLWPLGRFALLADELIERHQATVCFTGSTADIEAIDQIRGRMKNKADNFAGRTRLLELAALYQRMACLVTTDTGPMHIAAAVGTPVVALFGPTAEWRTGPYGPGHTVVSVDIECRPCFKRSCNTQKCMTDIPVDIVARRVVDVLGR